MAFKMKGAPYPKSAFKHDNPNEPFHVHDTPENKVQRDLDAMAAGSRFHPDGTRKKGEDKKMAKEMRKWTGLDQQKYDREARRESNKFERKYGKGQEGLDKYKKKQKRKNKRGNLGKAIKSGWDRLTGKTVGKGGQAGSGFKPDCSKGNCGAYD